MRFLWTKLDASWKQKLGDKEKYTTEEEVYAEIDKILLEFNLIHFCRMKGIEMTRKNGDLISLFLKQLIDAGNLAEFNKMTIAAL